MLGEFLHKPFHPWKNFYWDHATPSFRDINAEFNSFPRWRPFLRQYKRVFIAGLRQHQYARMVTKEERQIQREAREWEYEW